jgi:hypothetical protein
MVRGGSSNLLAGPASLELRPGQYAGFMVRIAGLTAAGAAPTLANFGTLGVRYKRGRIFSTTLSAAQEMDTLDFGLVESAIGAAGGNPITISAIIPASRVGDGNIFQVGDNDGYELTLDLNGIAAANVASGTVTAFGIPAQGVQKYIPQVFSTVPSIPASGFQNLNLKYENVSALYLFTLTNLDLITVIRDGQVLVDASVAEMLALSNMDNRIEAAHTTGLKIDLNRSGALGEQLSDDLIVKLTATAGGAATPELIVISHDFTPDDLQRSASSVTATVNNALQRKVNAGLTRPVKVVDALK